MILKQIPSDFIVEEITNIEVSKEKKRAYGFYLRKTREGHL